MNEKPYSRKRVERFAERQSARKVRRMRDGRQQPETLIARAKEEFKLPHHVGPDGRVDYRNLPWVVQPDAQLTQGDRQTIKECAVAMGERVKRVPIERAAVGA